MIGMNRKLLTLFVTVFLLFITLPAAATEFTSSSFKVLDPNININSATSSSSSFRLFSSMGQLGIATSTSSAFGIRGGFLYFPFVTTPVVSATAGDAKVDLSWTAATAGVGWSISGYSVGQSTTSGGPYTNTDVGNVLSSSRTSLTNGTTYYFVIRVLDAFSNSIATSTQVSGAPVAPAPAPAPAPSGGGGGGGGGGYVAPIANVVFTGRAYPRSTVTLLKDAQIAASTIAGSDANFQMSLSGLTGGNYIFSVYSEDKNGIRSSLLTFSVSITSGVTTNVSGIFIAPTIAVDKSEVKRGDDIAIFGQSVPKSDIVISVSSEEEFFGKTIADKDGIYFYNFDTSFTDYGTHYTKSKSSVGNLETSGFSSVIGFKIGTKNVLAPKAAKKILKGDINSDGRVNLIDFSIAAYWYKRTLNAAFKSVELVKLSGDGKVDLVDFSIMAYYWTG